MIILVVNAGSSSLKYQLINMDDESVIAKGNCDRIGIDGHILHKTDDGRKLDEDCILPTHTEAFVKLVNTITTGDAKVIDSIDVISAVGHRIVHGAGVFDQSVLVNDAIIDKIDELSELAPVHNHAHALALRACKSIISKNVPQVAVFDTAFHKTIPKKAYMFGLPYDDYEKLHVRKYGFHGISHQFVSSAFAKAIGNDIKNLKIISCHLGNGSSITAVNSGKSVDTSMGFTPLDGIVMGTRSGSVDPSAVTFVADKHGFTPSQMNDYMNKQSGFLGISGVSSDNRDLIKAAANGNARAQLVSDMLVYEIKKYIGSYVAVMNGLDAILFTGGIGENAYDIREQVCKDMEFFGIKLDKVINNGLRGKFKKISTVDSKVEIWIVPTNEELLIARDTLKLISSKKV